MLMRLGSSRSDERPSAVSSLTASPSRSSLRPAAAARMLFCDGSFRDAVDGEISLDLRRQSVLAHFLDEHRMDPRILILVFDLIAAFLDAGCNGDLGAFCGAAGGASLASG